MTDFLGGLIKPGDGARHAAERELRRRVEAWGQSQFPYRGPADFILRHGRYYQPRETPDEYAHLRGPLQRCFANSLAAAQAEPELTYTEGIYMVLGHARAHAWCTAPDGRPVELTFPTDPDELAGAFSPLVINGDTPDYSRGMAVPPPSDRWAYYGVEFPVLDFVADTFNRNQVVSLIDLPERGYPLLQQPWTPTMRRLP